MSYSVLVVAAGLLASCSGAGLPGLTSIPCASTDLSCVFEFVSSSEEARRLYRDGLSVEGSTIEILEPLTLNNIRVDLPQYTYDGIIQEITYTGLTTASTSHFEAKKTDGNIYEGTVTQLLNLRANGRLTEVYKSPNGDIPAATGFHVEYTNMTVRTTFPISFVTGERDTFVKFGPSSSELIMPLPEKVTFPDEYKAYVARNEYISSIHKQVNDNFQEAQKSFTQVLVNAIFAKIFEDYRQLLKIVPLAHENSLQ